MLSTVMEQPDNKVKNDIGFPEHVSIPESMQIERVSMDNRNMQEAFKLAQANAFEHMTVTASVVVKDGKVIGKGINGDGWHQREGRCERAGKDGVGKDYEDCPGCESKNHSERVAIRFAQETNDDLSAAELYMYGHWWLCEPCMQAASEAGIKTMFLLEDAKPLFDRNNPEQPQNKKAFVQEWLKKLDLE